jgi:hypothetical protein
MVAIISILSPVILFAQDQTPPYHTSTDKSFEIFELCIPVLLILAILYAVVSIFRIKAENKIRQQLIDKGIPDDTLKQMLMNGNQRIRLETLKWGLIIGCTGIGLYICQFFTFSFITFAILFVSISFALLIFYFLTKSINRT